MIYQQIYFLETWNLIQISLVEWAPDELVLILIEWLIISSAASFHTVSLIVWTQAICVRIHLPRDCQTWYGRDTHHFVMHLTVFYIHHFSLEIWAFSFSGDPPTEYTTCLQMLCPHSCMMFIVFCCRRHCRRHLHHLHHHHHYDFSHLGNICVMHLTIWNKYHFVIHLIIWDIHNFICYRPIGTHHFHHIFSHSQHTPFCYTFSLLAHMCCYHTFRHMGHIPFDHTFSPLRCTQFCNTFRHIPFYHKFPIWDIHYSVRHLAIWNIQYFIIHLAIRGTHHFVTYLTIWDTHHAFCHLEYKLLIIYI